MWIFFTSLACQCNKTSYGKPRISKRYKNNGQKCRFYNNLGGSLPIKLSRIQPYQYVSYTWQELIVTCCVSEVSWFSPSQSIMMNYSVRRLSISTNANPAGMSEGKKLSRSSHESIQAVKQKYHIAMKFRSTIRS